MSTHPSIFYHDAYTQSILLIFLFPLFQAHTLRNRLDRYASRIKPFSIALSLASASSFTNLIARLTGINIIPSGCHFFVILGSRHSRHCDSQDTQLPSFVISAIRYISHRLKNVCYNINRPAVS